MDVLSQGLVLTSMTLRGVGSYLYGQRLELRPLTILCGENGSGKSTWFKALNLLKDSQGLKGFPFQFKSEDEESWWHNYTNAYLKMFAGDCADDHEAEKEYGPVGTIGLHFQSNYNLDLEHGNRSDSELPQEEDPFPRSFLLDGRCPKQTRFRIRLAHPDISEPFDPPGEDTLRSYDIVELQINGSSRITFRKAQSEKRYLLEISRSLIEGQEPKDHRVKQIAEYDLKDDTIHTPDGALGPEHSEMLCRLSILRIRQLMLRLFQGIFSISAIRTIENRPTIQYDSEELELAATKAIQSRNVGLQGQWTWDLERVIVHTPTSSLGPVWPFSFACTVAVSHSNTLVP